jgi:FPC/CPF motif-containing protein YcgG
MALFNPFCSEEAISHSNYCTLQQKEYTTIEPIKGRKKQATEKVASKLSAFVADQEPQQALGFSTRKKSCSFGVYPELGSKKATAGLCRDLVIFLDDLRNGKIANTTYMAVFITPSRLSKEEFLQKVALQRELLQQATEPFYCTPESIEPSLLEDKDLLMFGGKLLKMVSIYRNSSQGQLKFDYPMLAFSVQGDAIVQPDDDQEERSAEAQSVIERMSRRHGAGKAKA